jgi:hypothetical protein
MRGVKRIGTMVAGVLLVLVATGGVDDYCSSGCGGNAVKCANDTCNLLTSFPCRSESDLGYQAYQSCAAALTNACRSGADLSALGVAQECIFFAHNDLCGGASPCVPDPDAGLSPDCGAALKGQMAFAWGCVIDGGRVPVSAPNPDNECVACLPDASGYDWTALPPDTICDAGGTCRTGACI